MRLKTKQNMILALQIIAAVVFVTFASVWLCNVFGVGQFSPILSFAVGAYVGHLFAPRIFSALSK